MLQEADQPILVHRVEERSDVGVQYEAHLLAVDPDAERIHRIMRAAPRPEAIREPEEVLLVDRVQHRSRRPLDDLVFKGGNRQRPLTPVRFGYVHPPGGMRPVRSTMHAGVQVLEIALEVCLVIPPRQPVHAGRGVLLEFVERLVQMLDADVVEERGEPLLLPLPCGLPYALQRLVHGSPVLRPARALLARIPLGPRPWLHRLRCAHLCRCLRTRLVRFVRRLQSYYGGVRLLVPVHHRLRLLAFPMRTAGRGTWRRPVTRPPRFRYDPVARDAALDPGRASAPRIAVPHMLPSSE